MLSQMWMELKKWPSQQKQNDFEQRRLERLPMPRPPPRYHERISDIVKLPFLMAQSQHPRTGGRKGQQCSGLAPVCFRTSRLEVTVEAVVFDEQSRLRILQNTVKHKVRAQVVASPVRQVFPRESSKHLLQGHLGTEQCTKL